jgi:uncharacterized protein YciI
VTASVAQPQGAACRRFAYFLDDVARPPRAAVAAHLRYLATLESRDVLVIAGRFRDGRDGVVCVLADDEFDADAIARVDPLVAFGYTLYRLREILDEPRRWELSATAP